MKPGVLYYKGSDVTGPKSDWGICKILTDFCNLEAGRSLSLDVFFKKKTYLKGINHIKSRECVSERVCLLWFFESVHESAPEK